VSRQVELRVADMLNQRLPIKFTGHNYPTTWGKADDYAVVGSNCILVLEVEQSQNHPHTNVLKLWPFLQSKKDIEIILVQTFFPDSKGTTGSRRLLNDWIVETMQRKVTKRFNYCRLEVSDNFGRVKGIGELRKIIREHQNR